MNPVRISLPLIRIRAGAFFQPLLIPLPEATSRFAGTVRDRFPPCLWRSPWCKCGVTSKTVSVDVPAKALLRLESFFKDFTAAVDRAKKQMRRDQAEIERLKTETRLMLAELKALALSE